MARTIREVMTPEPVTLPLDASLTEAARLMRDEKVRSVPGRSRRPALRPADRIATSSYVRSPPDGI